MDTMTEVPRLAVGDRVFSHGHDFWGVEIDPDSGLPLRGPMWAYVSPWQVIADNGDTLLLQDVTSGTQFLADVPASVTEPVL